MSKKYTVEITQQDDTWSAAIVRRVSSKKTTVSKQQEGFQSEAEAKAWGEAELKAFMKQLSDKNKARSEQRQQS